MSVEPSVSRKPSASREIACPICGDDVVEQVQIAVNDLKIAADIGVHADEIGRKQLLVVHALVEMPAQHSDSLSTTFDYNKFLGFAEELTNERISLIETFAVRLANRCLAVDGVSLVDITVVKPGALMNGRASTRIVKRARSRNA